jgi:hypothetical protein
MQDILLLKTLPTMRAYVCPWKKDEDINLYHRAGGVSDITTVLKPQ